MAFRLSTVDSGLAVSVSVGEGVSVSVGVNVSVRRVGVSVAGEGVLVSVLSSVRGGVVDVADGPAKVDSVHDVVLRKIRIRIVPFFIPTLYYRLCFLLSDFCLT